MKLKCYYSKTGQESPKNASKIISKMKLGGSQYIKSDKKVEKIAKSGEKVSVNSIKKYFETISGSQASSVLKADSEVEEVVKITNKVEDKESVKDKVSAFEILMHSKGDTLDKTPGKRIKRLRKSSVRSRKMNLNE